MGVLDHEWLSFIEGEAEALDEDAGDAKGLVVSARAGNCGRYLVQVTTGLVEPIH